MGQETENIEAKLAAYIDGQLGSVERLEIEKYLANNAEHRALIAELMRTRDVMTSLPKEPAPSEILEMLHGQLERSALLDGPAVSQPALRISRGPQLMALAAILFLTVGLAIVLYIVLFPSHPIAFSIAPTKPPATMDAVAQSDREAPVAAAMQVKLPTTENAADGKITLADAAPLGKATYDKASATTMPGNAGDALVMVVATDNPELTKNQVTAYLNSNGIAVQPVTEPMPEPLKLGQTQAVDGARFNFVQKQFTQTAPPVQQSVTNAGEPNNLAAAISQNQQAASTQISQPENAYVARGISRRQISDLAYSLSNSRKGQQAYFSPDDAPAAREIVETQSNARQSASQPAATLETKSLGGSVIVEKDKYSIPDAGNEIAVASAVPTTSPVQAPLPTGLPEESHVRSETVATSAPAASQPSQVLAKNDTLMISVSDLAGPGLDSVLRATVADDGTISLPAIGKISAAGLTATQCQEAIATQVRTANLVQNATVSVRKLDEVATAHPRVIQKASTLPTDEKVDVLILLRNQQSPNAPSPSIPTTEPRNPPL